jgi:hypothetical protein
MAKDPGLSNALLRLIFLGESIPGLADNAALNAVTDLWVGLYTGVPTTDQTQFEVAYGSYGRVPVARDASGWVVFGNDVYPVATVNFPQVTGGAAATASFVGIGTHQTGSGMLLYVGAIVPQIAISLGVTPQFMTSSLVEES